MAGLVTRVPCDWDLFLNEARAAATQLLEYRIIKARSEMKPGTDEAAVAAKLLSAIKAGEYVAGDPRPHHGGRRRGREREREHAARPDPDRADAEPHPPTTTIDTTNIDKVLRAGCRYRSRL